jgi:ABC-type transport system substrate-binding protein
VVAKLNVELDQAKRYSLFRDAESILDADPPVILIGGDQVDPVWNRDFKGLNLQARAWGQWGRFETGWLDK